MAKKAENRSFNVCVVGLSGTEKEKGVVGVGKSCLCNRFMRPQTDDYHTDHISVLSQSDFGGRVVNNDHFLYWGEVTKMSDDGTDFSFHVVEHTEFVDDSSFQPFKSGKTEPYHKRCAAAKLQSAEKLMYICKNQLGLEHEFPQKMLPDGRLNVDGFLCMFDVSVVPKRSMEAQVEYTTHILNNLVKSKKPIVLVTTKNDEAHEPFVREAERLANRKEYKGNIPVVETSAHVGVNVEMAFITLTHLIDRTRGRPKIMTYSDAARAQKEIRDVATEAYLALVRAQVTDYKALWVPALRKLQHNDNYIHYRDLCGTDQARRLFRKHTAHLKSEYVKRKQDIYLEHLQHVLRRILPDMSTIADRSWPSTLRWLPRQEFFEDHFVIIPDQIPWDDSDHIETTDTRIPYDLLESHEAEAVFRNHVNNVRAEYKKTELMKQFKQLLEDNHNVCAGKSLNEVAIFFLGRESFSALSETDKNAIYEQHQRQIRERAKAEFLELLLENAAWFSRFENRQVTNEDVRDITMRLQSENRFRALDRLDEDRKAILLKHLGFVQCPHKDRCPFRDHCMDVHIDNLLATKAHRPQSWSRNSQFLLDAEDNRLNLVLLGSDMLGDHLARQIRLQCVEDEYILEEELFSLDYRVIDGDVSLPQNSLKTQDFMPHGCFCVYSSLSTLAYIRESLDKTLLSDLQSRDQRSPFQGLPVVLVLAHNPHLSDKGLADLREHGQQLSDRLQCPFIDIPSSLMVDDCKRFHQDQIGLAMHSLVKSIKHRSSFINPWQIAESIEPDIRILMCFMCGDGFACELPLAPLLNHQCCFVNSDRVPTITLETFLDESKRKVEVTVASYHTALSVREDLYHGFILVYSAKRRASLSNLRVFAEGVSPVPTKVLAVTESGAANAFFCSDRVQVLLTEGNALADQLHASFSTTCHNFQLQTASYTPFFKECWERKMDTESAFTFSGEDSSGGALESSGDQRGYNNHYEQRPIPTIPTIPKPPRTNNKKMETFGTGKGSTSNSQSTEDSEPLYEETSHVSHCHSDSEADRGSSVSPPPPPPPPGVYDRNAYPPISEDQYSEGPDTEHLIKPSQLKSRRAARAEYRKSFPSAMSTFSSTYCYREDSTDTDSSNRSPKQPHHDRFVSEAPYQFKKSNSMKLALQDEVEAKKSIPIRIPEVPSFATTRRRLLKSTTLPYSATLPDLPDPGYQDDHRLHLRNIHGQAAMAKPRVGALDVDKFAEVRQVISRNINQPGADCPGNPMVQAPLATPEHIEISDYAQVKDALATITLENNYARVADALPDGHIHRIRSRKTNQDGEMMSDSDSEYSSLERAQEQDIYSRVNRRPTPHKKKYKPRHTDGSLPPPLPPYTDDRQKLITADHLDKLRSNSPSEGSEGTGDEQHPTRKLKKKSFRNKSKKKVVDYEGFVISPPLSDSDLTNSPHSKASMDDDCNYDQRYYDCEEPDGGNWKNWLKFNKPADPEKQRRREEKKAKEDEKKRQKEEERKQKEEERKQRKLRKGKDGRGLMTQCSISGTVLEELIQSEDNLVPYFVEKCVTYIEQEGLDVEGLYRVPGNKAHVDLLIDKFKDDQNVDILSLDIQVNAVATALKQFFAELSDPVIPASQYDPLIDAAAQQDEESRLQAIKDVLSNIPDANFQVLKYLMTHLHRVTEHYRENNMDSQNLAICWWPTLLRPDFSSFEKMAAVSRYLSDVVMIFIDKFTLFFYYENEV